MDCERENGGLKGPWLRRSGGVCQGIGAGRREGKGGQDGRAGPRNCCRTTMSKRCRRGEGEGLSLRR